MNEFSKADATTLAELLRQNEVSSTELIDASLAQARKWQASIEGIAHEARSPVRSQQQTEGMFGGVPSFVKDLEDVKGMPTGYGSKAGSHRIAKTNSKSVQQFLDSGFVCLGKSTTAEFGLNATTEPVFGKPTRNPHHPEHSSGGSSGGAAALVSSGIVPIAHGTDGGGSIRIPASFCGLVGLKASRGRLAPMASEKFQAVPLTTYGVLTRSLRDTIAFYQDIERREGTATGLSPIGKHFDPEKPQYKIGLYVEGPSHTLVNPQVKEAVLNTGKILERHGHSVELIAYPFKNNIEDWFVTYWSVMAQTASLFVALGREPQQKLKNLEPWTRSLSSHFRRYFYKAPSAIRGLRGFEHEYNQAFGSFDLLLSPTTADVAPPLGHIAPTNSVNEGIPKLLSLVPFTPPHNASGAPAISLPMARSTNGLPIGVQLSARLGQERKILETSMLLEEHFSNDIATQ